MRKPITITVRVKPGSSKGPLVEVEPGSADTEPITTVYLQQRAVDGKANAALVKVLAAHYGVSKSRVEIVRGHASRFKVVRIEPSP